MSDSNYNPVLSVLVNVLVLILSLFTIRYSVGMS